MPGRLPVITAQNTIYNPHVFKAPTGITTSLLYQASLRIPAVLQKFANGKLTSPALRISTGAAGQLVMTQSSSGVYQWSVTYVAVPDR